MDYYADLIKRIDTLIEEEKFQDALKTVEEELSVAYVPRDVENKLNDYLEVIKGKISDYKNYSLSDEEIEKYLKADSAKQLLAVQSLSYKNLRDYTDTVNEYLCSDGYINAKVLLIDALIKQEIGEEIRMEEKGMSYEFIPKYLLPVEESDGFLEGDRLLQDRYMKEPSKYLIARQLLYKEMMLLLPLNQDDDEGRIIAERIIEYVEKCFR